MANQLGTRKNAAQTKAEGCCTPKEDKTPQKICVPPQKVLPIIFLPGIMGSNLRLKPRRQAELGKNNNIAWRPDRLTEAAAMMNASPTRRQLQLDPSETEVDTYDPGKSITGDSSETLAERHAVGFDKNFRVGANTVLLSDDPIGAKNSRTKEVKAMERGWSEVYLDSYQSILETCEQQLNRPTNYTLWNGIFDRNPKVWGAEPANKLKPLIWDEYTKALKGCWFPVHAMGYNWLESNSKSAKLVAKRISTLINKYKEEGYSCEKVILITHSMGGLLARAIIHPEIGGIADQVLGVVHGVMPAIGAPAAYRRMRCGTENSGISPANKVLGDFGSEVTAVLGNSQGGLELLPSNAYGNGWLEIQKKGVVLKKLPENGDPYSEIYKLKGPWYRLFREDWLNPAGLPKRGFKNSCALLDGAKSFHEKINSVYHELSFAHYGADPNRPSWETLKWELDPKYSGKDWEKLCIYSDGKKGNLRLFESDADTPDAADLPPTPPLDGEPDVITIPVNFSLLMGPSTGAGDQTVPLRSSDHQLLSNKFTGIFRQVGYEHQKSYKDLYATKVTLYSLVRIIEKMNWPKNEAV